MAPRAEERRRDRGVVAVLSVFFVLLLLTFLAVAVNVGRLMQTRGDLHHAADSAALALAETLIVDSPTALDNSLALAQAYAARYRLTTGVTVHDATLNPMLASDIRFGHWHEVAGPCKFDGVGGNCPVGFEWADPAGSGYRLFPINAAQVTTRYTLPTVLNYVLRTGNVQMTATSTAVGRRHEVACSLPVAIPSCRGTDPWTGERLFDSQGMLDIPSSPGYRRLVFTSGRESAPDLTPWENEWAFGRVDLAGQRDYDWDGQMRQFIRMHTYNSKADCLTDMDGANRWTYGTGPAPMSQATSGYGPRPNIEPLIDGLLGLSTDGNVAPPTHPCTLGQTHVVPIVDAPGGCGAWPAEVPASVIGYVNVVFRRVICSNNTTFLDATNCNDPAMFGAIQGCTAPVVVAMVRTSGHLRVEVEVYGGSPVGPAAGRDQQSRLVR